MKNEFPDPGFLFAPQYIIGSICNRFGVLRQDRYHYTRSVRNALFTKFDLIFLELKIAPILHITTRCSMDNVVSFIGKISKKYAEDCEGGSTQNGIFANFHKFQIAITRNRKQISSQNLLHLRVFGDPKHTPKCFRPEGAGRGSNSKKAKRSIRTTENFSVL